MHKMWHWQGRRRGSIGKWCNNHYHISRSIVRTRHVVLYILFDRDHSEANIQKVSIHTHFRTPTIPEKGNRDKKEKEKIK